MAMSTPPSRLTRGAALLFEPRKLALPPSPDLCRRSTPRLLLRNGDDAEVIVPETPLGADYQSGGTIGHLSQDTPLPHAGELSAPCDPLESRAHGAKLLGRGTYGSVYEHSGMAIKVVNCSRWVKTPDGRTRAPCPVLETQIVSEIRITRLVRGHPNVVMYLGHSHDPTCMRWLLAMEIAEGTIWSLCTDIMPRTMTLYQLAGILRDAASGLKHVHSRGVIHCDLTAANLLYRHSPLRGRYVAIVSDFGLSKSLPAPVHGFHSEERIQQFLRPAIRDANVMPWQFRAPEVFRHPHGNTQLSIYGAKIDVWGLGIVAMVCMSTTRKVAVPTEVIDASTIDEHVANLHAALDGACVWDDMAFQDVGLYHPLLSIIRSTLSADESLRPSAADLVACLDELA